MPGDSNFHDVILNYLTGHLRNFEEDLEIAIKTSDAEAIHRYRVSVKRIRSVFKALNKISDKKILPGKLLKPYRNMFKAGGSIRDEQVQLEIIKNFEKLRGVSFPFFRDYSIKAIGEQLEVFKLAASGYDPAYTPQLIKIVNERLGVYDPEELEKKVYSWINRSIGKLKKERKKTDTPALLHIFRTRFKTTTFVIGMIYKSDYTHLIEKESYQKLKDFGQDLGNWHDHYQLLSKSAEVFGKSKDPLLIEEAFHLKKILVPVHDKLFHDMQLALMQDGLFEFKDQK